MKKGKIPVLITIILLGTLLSPAFIHTSHAAAGEVCLADPSTAPCPSSLAVFDGPKGQQIRIGVFISASAGLDGFDITLLTNHTVLTPFGVDLVGSVLLGAPVVVNECLLGQLVKGTTCAGTDTIDTIHLAATSALGSPLTSTPTSGLLFTAIYNITGTNNPGSPISVGFQTGCSNTSVSNTCVTVANGTPSPDPEAIQAGSTFDNSASSSMAIVALSSSSTNFGPEFPNTSNTAIINATALNGFPGFGGTDSVSITDQASSGLTATISGTNPCTTGGTSCAVTLTLTANSAGNYFVTVFGTYSTVDPSGNPDTLVSTVSITISVYDFGLTVRSTSISFSSGSTATDGIALTSLNNFAGTITLSMGSVLPAGLAITFSPSSFSLVPGATVNTTATFTASPSTATTYHATIRATSGTHVKTSATIVVTVTSSAPDFMLAANPTSFTIAPGGAVISALSITSVGGFSGKVSLNTTSVSSNLIVGINPANITLATGQTAASSVTISTLASTPPGTYSAAIAGISGTLFHTVSISVLVTTSSSSSGLVCIAKSGSTTCPVSPPLLNSTKGPPSQVRVAIVVDSSPGLDGFDITLTSQTILKPAGVDLTDTILLGSPIILLECISGQLIAGSGNCSSTDTAGTLHLAATSSLGSPLTANPITGLLFTAIYNVTGTTSGTSIGFQTGCAPPTSVSNTCVTIANGTPTPDPERVQAGMFTNTATFSLQQSPFVSSLKVGSGSSDSSLSLGVSSINGFTGTVTLTDTISPPGPTVTFSQTSAILNVTSPTTSVKLTVTAPLSVALGNYNLTITATNGTIFRSLTIIVIVVVPDFSITVNPQSLTLDVAQSGTASLTLTSFGFKGLVTIATVTPTGLTSSVQQTSLSLSKGATNSSVLTIHSSSSTVAGTYTITITGASGSLSHSVTLAVSIADFILNVHTTAMSLPAGGSGATAVEIHSLNFTGPVDLSASAPSGLTTNFGTSPILVSLIPSSDFFFFLIIYTNQNITAGTYRVNVTAASPSSTHTETILVTALVPSPDFSIVAVPNFMTISQGASTISSINLAGSGGFTGSVTLTVKGPSNGPSLALQPSTVILNKTANVSSSVLTVTAIISGTSSVTPVGTYNITISGTSGSTSHAVFVIVSVTSPPPPDFTISANPSFVEVHAGQNATSTITLASLFGFTGNITLTSIVNGVFVPPGANEPNTTLLPSKLLLRSGGSATSLLLMITARSTTPLLVGYQITVTGTNGTDSHSVVITLPVLPPLDIPPVANFTFTPRSPIVGQQVSFNGTLSFDPDGFVALWIWNFGDGFTVVSSSPFANHSYFNSGNYTVTLTVQDNAGLASSKSETIFVQPQPQHDVSVIGLFVSSTTAVSSQRVFIEVELRDDGTNPENVSVTVYANGQAIQTLSGLFIQNCGSNCFYYVEIAWDTTNVAPGQYTISATISLPQGETDPTPQDNSITDGTVTILPAPVIVAVPASGTVGAKIIIEGTGFPNPSSTIFGPQYDLVEVSFDDMNLGFVVTTTGTFNFTLDVPIAQAGPHLIKAFDEVSGAHTTTSFLVLPVQGTLAVTVTTGALYFPGDTATIYVLTSLNGAPPAGTGLQLQLILVSPNGTLTSLKTVSISPGLYKATFAIPKTGSLGTYSLVASAQTPGATSGTALAGFEVNPSWLSSHSSTVAGGTAVAGVFGFAAIAWRKGYFRKRNENEPTRPEDLRGAEN